MWSDPELRVVLIPIRKGYYAANLSLRKNIKNMEKISIKTQTLYVVFIGV
jgi:hypothetical protein